MRSLRPCGFLKHYLLFNHLTGVTYLLENPGFTINRKKSVMNPAQTFEFLGLTVDSTNMELCLPPQKMKSIRTEARKLARLGTMTARSLACLLGMMNATSCVIPPAPLFCCHLQMTLSNTLERNSQHYKAQVILPQDCLEELEWWDTNMGRWNGRTILKREMDLAIDLDASLQGWGASCNHQRTAWSELECRMYINYLELLAATLVTQTFAKSRTGISILLRG